MNARKLTQHNLDAFFLGLGGMCGVGYEYALYVLNRNDDEALARDWQRMGQDWNNVLGSLEEDRSKQVALEFPIAGVEE